MKNFLVAVLSAIFIFGMSVTANAQEVDEQTKNFLDGEFSKMIGNAPEQVIGLGVIAFKDGEPVYKNFSGKRNLAKNLPVTEDSRFRVASLTKMFTMFGIMQLVEQNKIDLDEDVSKYLGFQLRNPNFPEEKITVRMLASHTSTLRDAKGYVLPPPYTLEDFFKPGGVAYEGGKHFADKDKSYFTYCNLNYGVLGTVIEKVSGERFDKFIKKNVLQPMNISADYVVGNLSKEDFQNLGALYNKADGKWSATTDIYSAQPRADILEVLSNYVSGGDYNLKNYKIGTNATIFNPAGSLRISFAELGNCLEMIMNGGEFRGKKIISQESLAEMCKQQWIYNPETKNGNTYEVMFSYGLGLYQIDGAGDARLCKDFDIDLIGHSGEAYGMISGLYFRPGTKDGVIFMINGVGVEPGVDEKSFGKFGNGFIWEEEMMNPICEKIFVGKE